MTNAWALCGTMSSGGSFMRGEEGQCMPCTDCWARREYGYGGPNTCPEIVLVVIVLPSPERRLSGGGEE